MIPLCLTSSNEPHLPLHHCFTPLYFSIPFIWPNHIFSTPLIVYSQLLIYSYSPPPLLSLLPVTFSLIFPCLCTSLVSSMSPLLIPSHFTHCRAPSSHRQVWAVPLVHLWEGPLGWCPVLREVWWVQVPRFLQHLLQPERRPQLILRSANSSSSNWYSCFMHTSASGGSRPTVKSGSATCPTAALWRTSSTTWLTARLGSPVRVSRRDATCVWQWHLFQHYSSDIKDNSTVRTGLILLFISLSKMHIKSIIYVSF